MKQKPTVSAAEPEKQGAVILRQLPVVFSLALYLCWAMLVRYTNIFFVDYADTQPSYLFTLATVVTFFACCLVAVHPRVAAFMLRARTLLLLTTCLSASASVIFGSGIASGEHVFPYSMMIVGALVGLSFCCASLLAFKTAGCWGVYRVLRLLAWATPVALALFVIVNLTFPIKVLSIVCAVLPLTSALILLAQGRQPKGSGRTVDESSNQRQGNGWRTHGFTLAGLLFLSGFLFVYTVGMFPKTTHFAHLSTFGDIWGSTSLISIGSLMTTCAFIVIANILLTKRHRILTSIGSMAILLVLVATFYSMPLWSVTRLSFMLSNALAPCFLFIAVFLSLPAQDVDDVSVVIIRRVYLTGASGALLAGLASTALIGPLLGTIPFQDILFSSAPSLLLAMLLLLLFTLRKPIVALFFPQQQQLQPLDTSDLEQRCGLLAEQHSLTNREHEIVLLVSEGRNQPFIEQKLSISRATVKTHMTHIYRKCGVNSKQELIDLLRGV
jgi:DNA-binding CsgD family transcriptional regulator